MARNRPGDRFGTAAPVPRPQAAWPAAGATGAGGATAGILALALLLAPALGMPREEMLQDTLKSIVVSFCVLGAGLLFFWQQRERREPLRWHGLLWLPLALMAYALGSMAWSHTYLGGVEGVRWFIFSLLLWLGLNTLTRDRVTLLAWAIHGGAVIASVWAALQFWADWQFFPQGPNPGSTFVNRNFFAEFAVCTLPFSALLLARARKPGQLILLGLGSSLVIVAILMTGTRSALAALWLQLLVLLPLAVWFFRGQPGPEGTKVRRRLLASGLLVLLAVIAMGAVPAGNPKLLQEARGSTALERGLMRTTSITPGDPSLGIRMTMWRATLRMIEARPLSGVGAGAWEVEIPLYQADGSQLETDFYAHNEFLQLVAEYGWVGWLFLGSLTVYLIGAVRRTLFDRSAAGPAEAPLRAAALCSLAALFIVSNAGFPWRMAATGALFATCLAVLAASDARLGQGGAFAAMRLPWRPAVARAGMLATVAALLLAVYITQQAARAEWKLVRATKIALAISGSGDPASARWNDARAEVLKLMRDGIALNPHYRKLAPAVADEMARWGDWRNATWIWESMIASRPYVVALLTNAAAGHGNEGDFARSRAYLERAKRLQPNAPAVLTAEMALVHRTGDAAQALALARTAVANGATDPDLLRIAFALAWRGADYPLARRAMEQRMAGSPQSRVTGFLQLGVMYADAGDRPQALDAFRQAMALTPPEQWPALRRQIPAPLWPILGLTGSAAPVAPQTSVINK